MNNSISIIIPIYNSENYIKDTLDSIKRQSYQNYEVIIIDDGSTDNSYSICEKFKGSSKNKITLIHTANSGVSKARNLGLKYATGKYICFVDSDDILEENYLKNMLFNDNYNMSCCNYLDMWKRKRVKKIKTISKNTLTREQALALLFEKNSLGGYLWNKLFLNKVINNNKLRFDEDLFMLEDLLFVTKYLCSIKAEAKIKYTNKALYNYRMRRSSAVWQNNKKLELNRQLSYKRVKKLLSTAKLKRTTYDNIISLINGTTSMRDKIKTKNRWLYNAYIQIKTISYGQYD